MFVVGGDARESAGRFTDALGLLHAIDRLGPRPARIDEVLPALIGELYRRRDEAVRPGA